eukprot:1147241-Prorocentrum_minimum.AAC.2
MRSPPRAFLAPSGDGQFARNYKSSGKFTGISESRADSHKSRVSLQGQLDSRGSTVQTPARGKAKRIFTLPFRDWCPLRAYSLSPSANGARYGYILSGLFGRCKHAREPHALTS